MSPSSDASSFTPDNPQYRDRVAKLQKWSALGLDPFGQRTDGLMPVMAARELHQGVETTPHDGAEMAKVAGRIVLFRDIGKLIFITIQDWTGRIQIGMAKQAFAETWPQAKLLELGDIAWFEGKVGHTKTNEVTIWASGFGLLSKALLPPPDKFHGLSDTEMRYRQRYVDLYANPDSMDVFLFRSRIMESIRDFLKARQFVEVETPMMQAIAGGAAAKPFVTHHNALDIDLFLRISPELYLKRLLVGGMERVFEINRNFRNEGIDTTHNPEFTMMELYQAYSDLAGMMELTESLFVRLAGERLGRLGKDASKLHLQYGERIIDFTPPFDRVSYAGLFREHVGVEMSDAAAVVRVAGENGIGTANKEHDVIVGELFERMAEPALATRDRPTFLYDYPAALCPLTKRKPGDPHIAERFELYIAGMELANAYTELNDPFVQEATFTQQLQGQKADDSMAKMDEDFVTALRYGMPPAGGLGVGIDRLVMIMTNRTSIRDVVLFPLLKPAGGAGVAGGVGGSGGGGSGGGDGKVPGPVMLPRQPGGGGTAGFGEIDEAQMEKDVEKLEGDLARIKIATNLRPMMFILEKDGTLRVYDV